MIHWATKYIGKPAEDVGLCWGLLRLCYSDFGITLPQVEGLTRENAEVLAAQVHDGLSTDWKQIVEPQEYCAVGMSQLANGAIHHVGIFTASDSGKVIHCWGKQCVVADTRRGLWLKGFKVIKFYQHKLWPSS